MARIPLRAYNRDIEALIDSNQIDEAFAHCRHILESFPKHVDTYRLMGKALLEAQRFSDASDVFHRVLSCVPDDFIAHLGMSIIREDEKNLDAAIWHMERAFEVQPSNAAVQMELRKLYGLRDGLTPQKIQLTRGALARMSAKSHLYTQAISELRTALSEDPQRPDLQVVLAEMYLHTGARMEAIETCNSLASKFPYCLVANRVLAEVLPETERADRAQEFKDRSIELDPYYAHLSEVAMSIEQIPDGAVTIQRLDYTDEDFTDQQPDQPTWAASLGLDIEDSLKSGEPTPDWLIDEDIEFPSEEQEEPEDLAPPEIQFPKGDIDEPAEDLEPTPEWMSTAKLDDTLVDFQEPSEETLSAKSTLDSETPDHVPEWMEEQEAETENETPDWLRDAMEESPDQGLSLTDAGKVVGAAAVFSMNDQDSGDDIQDAEDDYYQLESSIDESAPRPEPDESIIESSPEELDESIEEAFSRDKSLIGEAVAGAAIAAEPFSSTQDDETLDNEDFTEESISQASQPEGEPSVEDTGEKSPEGHDEDLPAWLLELGEEIPSPSEETVLQDYTLSDEEEFDLEGDLDSRELEPIPVEDSATVASENKVDIFSEATEGAEFDSEFPETIPDWLSEVSPEGIPDLATEADTSEVEGQEIVLAEIPEWLRKMEQEHRADAATAGEFEEIEALDFDAEFTELTGEDVPSWLMTAMGTEISGEAEGDEIEEISEFLAEITEQDIILEDEITGDYTQGEAEEAVIGVESETEEFTEPATETIPETDHVIEEVEVEEFVAETAEGEVEIEPSLMEEVGQAAKIGIAAEIVEELSEEEETHPVVIYTEGAGLEIEEGLEEIEEEAVAIPGEEELLPPEEQEIEELAAISTEKPLSEEDQDAAMAWLESLAAKQGAAEDELLTSPEARREDVPEWIQESVMDEEEVEAAIEEEGRIDVAEAAIAAGAVAEAMRGEEEVEEKWEEVPITERPPEWVPEGIEEIEFEEEMPRKESLVSEVGEAEISEFESESLPEEPEEIAEGGEEIPDWLSGIGEEAAEPDISPEWSPEELPEEALEDEIGKTIPEKQIDLNAASLAQLEKIPGIGFIHAQRIVNYRAKNGPFKEFDELEKVPGITADMVSDIKPYLTIEVVPETPLPESAHPDLQSAWKGIIDGEIEASVEQYAQIIDRGEHLEEIIHDLQEALVRYPQNPALYQSLGDAYLRSDMLQEALDAYNRAEDLIQ